MPFTGFRITSPYGYRTHPVTGEKNSFHAGIDLVKSHKAPLEAFVGGEVLYAGNGISGTGVGGYGNVVVIKDSKGCAHVYAHLDSVSVSKGQTVIKGTVIGCQGATGKYVTGSHLHYEIRKKSSPSLGWTADQTTTTYEPTQYLIDYYATDKPVSSNGVYVVEKGDTLWGISQKYKTTVAVLKSLNAIDGDLIVPGQIIKLPINTQKAAKKETLYLPKTASRWRVYPTNKAPIKGNEKGFLNPKKFGGLQYEVLGKPQANVVTIQTKDFGKVNIYVGHETGAVIK